MPWSGGAFTRTNGVHTGATLWVQDRDAGTKILATRHDTHDQDLADGINSTLEKSGSNAATGNLDLGSQRITLLADGTAKTDAATVNQIQSNGPAYQATDTGTANAHVIALSPAITAYASGQKVTFKSGAASTTASTLNVNGLGVKAIKKLHDQDIASGDIESGSIVTVVYDGTNFQMTSQVATTASSGAPAAATSAKTAAYTVIAGDAGSTILCSAASADYAVALTAAGTLGDGFTVTLKKSDATKFMITINPNSTETIDGLLDLKLRNEHSEATLICDGSNWHLISHENVAIEYNAVENSNFLVDQYSHITRTGLGASNVLTQDRWGIATGDSPSGRWTYSKESGGGIDAKSQWGKFLCTTADSPGTGDAQIIRQSIIGNNMVGAGFLGTDGFFENMVISFDIIVHADGASSISFPATVGVSIILSDGTSREIIHDVSVAAADTWQRVYWVVPEDGTADIDPGVAAQVIFSISLVSGSGRQGTADTWANTGNKYATSSSDNICDATSNYLGITNCKFQPGQIATPFVPRLYAEELDICKYYFEKRINSNTYSPLANSFNRSTTIAAGFYGYSEKRAAPTIAFSGATEFGVTHGASADAQTSGVTAEEIHPTGCRVKFTVGSGLTAGEGSLLANWNNTTAYVTVSAEI